MIKIKYSCYEHKADLYYMDFKILAQRSTEQIRKTIESAMKKSDFTWYSFINILVSLNISKHSFHSLGQLIFSKVYEFHEVLKNT